MIDTTGEGGPAFPVVTANRVHENGISLWDYFAGQALVGFTANPHDSAFTKKEVVADIYDWADAMLVERTRHGDDGLAFHLKKANLPDFIECDSCGQLAGSSLCKGCQANMAAIRELKNEYIEWRQAFRVQFVECRQLREELTAQRQVQQKSAGDAGAET